MPRPSAPFDAGVTAVRHVAGDVAVRTSARPNIRPFPSARRPFGGGQA